MADFELPSNTPVYDGASTGRSWLQWFDRVHAVVSAQQQSGATANRPTSRLWIGRRYFDSTLGIPVYVQSVKPTVWVDAAGTVV